MTPKKSKSTQVRKKALAHSSGEKQAVKKFNIELQQAIDKVDWAKVTLPRQSC
jgi:hypothetical protein